MFRQPIRPERPGLKARQDGERHPLDGEPPLVRAGQVLGRTAKEAIVAALRDEAAEWTNFAKSSLKFVVNCVNSFYDPPLAPPQSERVRPGGLTGGAFCPARSEPPPSTPSDAVGQTPGDQE